MLGEAPIQTYAIAQKRRKTPMSQTGIVGLRLFQIAKSVSLRCIVLKLGRLDDARSEFLFEKVSDLFLYSITDSIFNCSCSPNLCKRRGICDVEKQKDRLVDFRPLFGFVNCRSFRDI